MLLTPGLITPPEASISHAGGCCCPGCAFVENEAGNAELLIESPRSTAALAAAEFNVYALHSLPGALHTIYLDFDGHTTSGTAWNSAYNNGRDIVSPGRGYTDAVKTRIWQRVAEDFIPFEVNVTTQDPGVERLRQAGPGDTQWGVRVVFTGDQSWLQDNVGYAVGGVAWLGSFVWSSDTPVFVFNSGEVAAAETASHEVGHALGLNHKGTADQGADGSLKNYKPYYAGHGSGATGWAPIMGSGFSKQLSQWSKGEYPRAFTTQDELARITTGNGFGYRLDQPTRAIGLDGQSQIGIIETRDDFDTFTFSITSAGTVTIDVTPAPVGPNLDILARLYNAAGELITTDNPLLSLGASIIWSLPVGNYYVTVEGTGKAANGSDHGYSDYGSLGQYTIHATLGNPVEPPPPSGVTAFDFGTSITPLADGYTRVTDSTRYSATLGYGWISGNVRSKRNDSGGSDLAGDFNHSSDATFVVNLANGTYRVTVTTGSDWAKNSTGVSLEGVADTFSTGAKEFVEKTYTVTVTDGQLTLRLTGQEAPLNGLSIEAADDALTSSSR